MAEQDASLRLISDSDYFMVLGVVDDTFAALWDVCYSAEFDDLFN